MKRDFSQLAIQLSLLAAFLMLGGKWLAYALTGSTAIFSDAAESVVHMAATGIAATSLWYSRRPADSTHPYGHRKIAYFSAGFEGILIFLAALAILATSVDALVRGLTLSRLGVGIAITGGLGLLNLALGSFLIAVGKRENTLTLVANGQHVLTDTWTSLGVVLGVALVWLTGIWWLDPIVAILVGLHIVSTATRLMRRSFDGLMERADPAVTDRILEHLERAVETGTIRGYHQLRHREADGELWIDFHLLFPGDLPLEQAHEIATGVERSIYEALPQRLIQITSHLEPAEVHGAHHPSGHQVGDPLTS